MPPQNPPPRAGSSSEEDRRSAIFQKLARMGEPVSRLLPTGFDSLDASLGGGLPRGRIVEIFGPPASGKTTLALHLAKSVQRSGSTAAWIDADRTFDPSYAAAIGLSLAGRAGTPTAALSHGERRALELAMVLASRPRLLLLDEPMAGMGAAESAEMISLLARLKARRNGNFAIVLVEHDMDAVFALADRITVLVHGRVVASGLPEAIRADTAVRRAYLGEEEAP